MGERKSGEEGGRERGKRPERKPGAGFSLLLASFVNLLLFCLLPALLLARNFTVARVLREFIIDDFPCHNVIWRQVDRG